MKLSIRNCRCCGDNTFERCEPKPVSPFFGTYGLGVSIEINLIREGLVRYLPSFLWKRLVIFIGKVLSLKIKIEYGACKKCYFTAPWAPISDGMLLDYYSFYEKISYKSLRSKSEYSYSQIAEFQGCDEELTIRREELEKFILPHLECLKTNIHFQNDRFLIMDYGGGTGKVSPRLDWADVDVFDVGDSCVNSVWRNNVEVSCSSQTSGEKKYPYVQLLHVLEHVGDPRSTLEKALFFLRDDGLLYIEVPYEMDDFDRLRVQADIWIDEHINKFCPQSVEAIVKSYGLEVLVCEEAYIKMLHITSPFKVVKCLAKKPIQSKQ